MNKKSKKILLIFPPQWTPISPHFALASLMGQLKSENYNAEAMDLNVEFYNTILSENYMNFILKKIKEDYVDLFTAVKNIYTKNKKSENYTLYEQSLLYKFSKIKKFLSKETDYYERIPNAIEYALEVIKDKKNFFKPPHLIQATNVIDCALELISLAYAPTHLEFDSCYNALMKLDFQHIKHFVFDDESNIFKIFFKAKLEEIKKKKADFIAISLNSTSQLVSGLTLCHLLKKHTKAHINIGGNFFGRIVDEIMEHPEFSIFCDSISIEEGEGPILECAKFANKEIKIQDVANLIWFKNKKVYKNEKMKPKRLNDIHNLNLDDFNLESYFSPYTVLPYQASRGCYWGKCTFCDQDFGQEFNIKDPKKVVFEMKELKEKYNVEHYEFIDDSMPPNYLKDLSDEILKEKIRPKFFCDARLETAFNEDTIKSAAMAGLRMFMWGLESGSNKIMKSINKGIDLKKRFEILKLANKYDIWNFAFIFFGYPLETKKDARKTIEMLCKNKDIINSYGRSVFTMGKHAKIACSPEEFGITKMHPKSEEFSPSIDFECVGMTKEELNEILEECKLKCYKYYKQPLWMYLRYREWLFLYIDKFGVKQVSNYSVRSK